MTARDRDQHDRAATPLELLFDLSFVVAVAQAAAALHHALVLGHIEASLTGYLTTFFGIWWAWMNFTWFASAYDTDDILYRLLTLLQIAGVLVLAAGVPTAFGGDVRITVAGYVLMRIAMVVQWLRAAREDPASRLLALRYAFGIAACQLGWVARLALPQQWSLTSFVVLALLELAVPVWAERSSQPTTWHPGHIAERYGLFTLIVLGESILAATSTVQAAIAERGLSPALIGVAAGGLALIFALWWTYFDRPAEEGLRGAPRGVFGWGYGHVLIFASLAAVGAGLQVVAETVAGHGALTSRAAALMLAIPTGLYLGTTGALHYWIRVDDARTLWHFAAAATLIIAVALATPPLALQTVVPLIALTVAGLVAVDLIRPRLTPPA